MLSIKPLQINSHSVLLLHSQIKVFYLMCNLSNAKFIIFSQSMFLKLWGALLYLTGVTVQMLTSFCSVDGSVFGLPLSWEITAFPQDEASHEIMGYPLPRQYGKLFNLLVDFLNISLHCWHWGKNNRLTTKEYFRLIDKTLLMIILLSNTSSFSFNA